MPDPAEVYVPEELRAAIEDAMGKYPDRRSAVHPRAARRPGGARLVLARGHPPGRGGDAGHPRLPVSVASFYDMLQRGARRRPPRVRVHRRGMQPRNAEAGATTRSRRRPRARASRTSRSASSSASARATWRRWPSDQGRYMGPLDPSDAREMVAARSRRAARSLPGRGLEDAGLPAAMGRESLTMLDELRLLTTSTCRACASSTSTSASAATRALRKALTEMDEDRCSRSWRTRACAAAAAPASPWARRPASCPRARWTSTSAATPTSPSRARSRTAC